MIHINPTFRDVLNSTGFTPELIFTHPDIKPWRKLNDRENCLWDITSNVRFHVKRFPASEAKQNAAQNEARGLELLKLNSIPTSPLVVWGNLNDGRSFIVTQDLAGYTPADKLVENGFPFDRLLHPTAALAAKLHNAGLHHRDLYLCHFMATSGANEKIELALIDAARVRNLPPWPFRRRWIVKDLAQFWYSMSALPISDEQKKAWLAAYAFERKIPDSSSLQRSIIKKSRIIAAHDVNLRRQQPERNISIPTATDSK
jgi:hypothetical protein